MTTNIITTQLIALGIFTFLYLVCYRHQKKYTLNRFVIWTSILFSLVLPFLSFKVFPYEISPINTALPTAETIISNTNNFDYLSVIYWIGVFISGVLLLISLIKIGYLIYISNFTKEGDFWVAYNSKEDFSFFNFIFLKDNDLVIKSHEIGHIKYFHSTDKLILELIKVLAWYNPFIYLFKKYLYEIHEYQADEYALNKLSVSKAEYAESLYHFALSQNNGLTLLNHFSSQLKNRIVMLSKNSSFNPSYLLYLPIALLLLSSFSFKKYPVFSNPINTSKIVLDTIKDPDSERRYILDTVEHYDPTSNSHKVKVYKTEIKDKRKSEKEILQDISKMKFSGKMVELIDTTEIYDNTSFSQYRVISKYQLPQEIYQQFRYLSFEKQEEIKQKYLVKSKSAIKD